MDKKELINNGKVKSVYTTDDENAVIIEFRDDMTAGDGARKEVMNKKGSYNALISTKLFKVLEENGIKTQFIDLPETNVMVAKKLEMIPIEVIVRNIATRSLIRKYPIADGTKLDPPIVQMDFKADEFHALLSLQSSHLATEKTVLLRYVPSSENTCIICSALYLRLWCKAASSQGSSCGIPYCGVRLRRLPQAGGPSHPHPHVCPWMISQKHVPAHRSRGLYLR